MLIESFSGIRGIVGKDLTEDTARKYAYVFFNYIKKKLKRDPLIVIGTDTRPFSDLLKGAMQESLHDTIDVGIAATPMIELAVREYKADCGIIITASHNEPEWNGFKFLDSDGAVLRKKDIGQVIADFSKIKDTDEVDFIRQQYKGRKFKVKRIYRKNHDIVKRYYSFLLGIIGRKNKRLIKKAKFKVIVDPNGGAGYHAIDILNKIGVNVMPINETPGIFKRLVEPNKESLSYLIKEVKKSKACLAAGFDCDADRVEIVTDAIVSGQYILALIVDDILKEKKGVVITNDATSGVVKDIVKKNGCKIMEVEVGEINVVDAMINNLSSVGGEGSSSGVIIPPSRCRDGILSLLYVLKIMAEKKQALSSIISKLPKYYTLRKKVRFKQSNHDAIKRKLMKHYIAKGFKVQQTGGIKGGLKVFMDDSWVWYRASKTEEGIFRVMADSKSLKKAKRMLSKALSILGKDL